MAMPQPVKGVDGRTYLPFFSNKYCFSNYFPSDFKVDGVMYSSVEQYFQHQKALAFNDASTAAYIMLSSKPKEATYLGRRVNGFDNIVWEDKCMEVMRKGVHAKFAQSRYLDMKLLYYYNDAVPVACDPSDHLWGVGLKVDDPRVLDPRQWLGLNRLGRCLMDARKQLEEYYCDAMLVE